MEGVWGNRLLILGVWVFGEALLARVRGGEVRRGGVGVGWVRVRRSPPVSESDEMNQPSASAGCEQNPRAGRGGGRGGRPYLLPHL